LGARAVGLTRDDRNTYDVIDKASNPYTLQILSA
jgi:hypothetical protein